MFKNNKLSVIGLGLISSVLAFSVIVLTYFGVDEINMLDGNYKKEKVVKAPSFSHISGFYENPFYLKISVPRGTTVYYTLDCSNPDETSLKYTAKCPIYLKDATENKNVYSARTDISVGFRSDLLKKHPTSGANPNYQVPKYNVDKCNVVRAVAITKDGRKSDIITGSYFVGFSASSFDNAKIISIVTDPDNLFNYKNGIYVLGEFFDKYVSRYSMVSYTSDIEERWFFWDANYRQKGKHWQRDANFEIFENNGKFLTSNFGGIRIQGNASRGLAQKSINFYSDSKKIENNLFDNGYKPNKISLSSGRNTIIKDYLISNYVNDLNFTTMHYIPCILFLDGEYWGNYFLTEKYDENYISDCFGIDKYNISMVKEGKYEAGDEIGQKLYNSMRSFISKSDMTYSDNYERACELIDMDSYVDYYSMMAYIARSDDWPILNEAAWRTVDIKEGKYSDGKWRWMLYDCNSQCMTDDLVNHNTLQYIIHSDEVFASLWKNPSFRARFEKRIFEIADKHFCPEKINIAITDYGKQLLPLYRKSWERYYGTTRNEEKSYMDSLESYRNFFDNRRAVVESWFDNK